MKANISLPPSDSTLTADSPLSMLAAATVKWSIFFSYKELLLL